MVNAAEYLGFLKVRDKIHHPYTIVALADVMLDKEEKVSFFPPFTVFCKKGIFPAAPMPAQEKLTKVHKNFFGDKCKYEQKDVTRTLSKMLTSKRCKSLVGIETAQTAKLRNAESFCR